MNYCRETAKMGVPARHASKARRAGHLATAGCWFRGVPERYVAGRACPEPVEGTPEDARKDGHIRGRSR